MSFLHKKASLADALLGAPLGWLAAYLAAGKEDRTEAARKGLILGALLGAYQGHKITKERIEEASQGIIPGEERVHMSPALVSLLAGLGAGGYYRLK